MQIQKVRTAILVHGCHLAADLNGKRWEEIVWGLTDDGTPTRNGRGTAALGLAFSEEAELIVFSTGASDRDGIKEGEYTRNWALEHVDSLIVALGFPQPSNYIRTLFRQYLVGERCELDLQSQNTREECERNFRLCASRDIERVFLVSSPWHIERCHKEALDVAQRMREAGERVPQIFAMASEGSTEGVVIIEPPHRGDRPKTRLHLILPRIFKLPSHLVGSFEDALDGLLRGRGV